MASNYASIGLKSFLVTLLCIVGVACVVGGITYSMELWGGKSLPDVVGMTQEDAENALQEEGFQTKVEKVGSDQAKGTVVGTDPEAGTRVDSYTPVTLLVATPKTVPDVCGMSLEEARSTLEGEGYGNIEVVEKASDKDPGTVLEQDPKAKSKAKSDELVTLTIATPFVVPNVIGMPATEAKSAIANAGFNYFVTEVYSDAVSEGCVVETVPPAGESIASSQTIEIKVAKSRSKEVQEVVERYLKGLSKVNINGRSYEISEVNDVEYADDSTCRFTLTVRPFETHSWFGGEPETRYGNFERISGSATVNDKNEVVSTDPAITAI